MTSPLWQPSARVIEDSNLTRFRVHVNQVTGKSLENFEQLHRFSVEQAPVFWDILWDYCGIIAATKGERVVVDEEKIPGVRYFPDARLNFAENLLRRRDETPALIFRGEDKVKSRMSWGELYDETSRAQALFKEVGIAPGDRVAAMMPNMPETIVAMLGATSLGATWSSCSPDFGERGVLDRFGQIDPKVLIVCDGYWYNGKRIDITERLAKIAAQLPSLERIVVVDYLGQAADIAAGQEKAQTWNEAVGARPAGEMEFVQVPFDHPLYILYSSGTTGAPKCIVHCVGGALLQHLKEQQLHCDLKPGDRLFYFTTCGWMMWNWLAGGLASELTLLLYDGSPFYPDAKVLFDYADEEQMTMFGTSAKYIDAVKKSGLEPAKTHSLASVRTITSTGSTLVPESFDFVYEAIKPDVHLASMSGGTDLCGCFVGGNPTGPVWRGEIQAPCLAMAVEVWDEDGTPIQQGKGELVCTRAFPSMPVMFWNDPDGEKYHNAYFARFPGVWCHGDFAEWTEHGGMVIHGRSDATLNPGGVRIGTAEIYAQVEQMPEIVEAIAIGQDWDNDVRIVLFVRLADGVQLSDELIGEIRARIKTGASPRHVPAKVVAVADIPRTKSGKITELAVRDVVHGREVKNKEALANPEALELFRGLPELKS